ncbi:MAG: dephospho-CoA kinase [Rubrivivax sp.]|nr:dephospho-CoA kinase [Rubrivivax sp.]
MVGPGAERSLPGRPRVATIGLTGGIGSGKSTAAQSLVALGAHLVDTDAIARGLTLPGGAAVPALAAEFGADALTADGALDREKMRRLVFADPGAKARLEAILHPLIGAEAGRQAAVAGGRPVVFDVPLLSESSHWRARVDRVLVIDCDEATQAARVARRPGWTEDAARRVIAQQASRAARRAMADAVIDNDRFTIDRFRAELRALWALWFPAPGGSA